MQGPGRRLLLPLGERVSFRVMVVCVAGWRGCWAPRAWRAGAGAPGLQTWCGSQEFLAQAPARTGQPTVRPEAREGWRLPWLAAPGLFFSASCWSRPAQVGGAGPVHSPPPWEPARPPSGPRPQLVPLLPQAQTTGLHGTRRSWGLAAPRPGHSLRRPPCGGRSACCVAPLALSEQCR